MKTHFQVLLKLRLQIFNNWVIDQLNQLTALSRLTGILETEMAHHIKVKISMIKALTR